MIPLNRTVKLLVSSGGILIVVWLAILAFGAASFNIKDSNSYVPSSKQPFYIRNEPEVEPNSPWRTVNYKELTIPKEAYESAKTFMTNETITQVIVPIKAVKTYTVNVDPPVLKSNLTFVFLHGAAFTSADWIHLGTLQLLGALGYRCRAIDLPGFGKTSAKLGTEKNTYMSKVEYFTLLSKAMKLENIILVSPSMSGNYALPFVLTHPEIFAGIVPIAPAASGIVPPSRLRALQVPTMLIYGDRDQSLGTVSHNDLKKIPNFQAVIVEKAGHAAYLDQPEVFHNLLYNFAMKVEHSWQ